MNEKVNTELSKVGSWLNSNKLSLNYSKTTYLLIEPKTKANNSTFHNFNVNSKGIKIQKSLSTKYLGVILDENLDWKLHITYLHTKLSEAVGILAKLRHYLNRKNLVVIFTFSFIHMFSTEFLVGVQQLILHLNLFKFFKTKF